MAEQKLTFAELVRGIELSTDAHHRITVLATKRLRLVGLFFDLDKCFLLPSAIPGIQRLAQMYRAHPDAQLLVVGHTDTSGRDAYNLTLSLERADAMAAFLTDDPAPWEAFFADDKPKEKRWGTLEIQHMLSRLPEEGPKFFRGEPNGVDDEATKQAVKDYQTQNSLEPDGIAGPLTRHSLIKSYMRLDGTSLPAGTTLTTHGCGENFPVSQTGDGVRDPENRRVEVFFFDGPIEPPPPGKTSAKGSTEYPRWLEQVEETVDATVSATVAGTLRLRVHADPQQAIDLDNQYRLFSDSGFEQISELPADADPTGEFVDLLFTGVPLDDNYSLEVLSPDGDDYLLLDNVPLASVETDDIPIDTSAEVPDDEGELLALEPDSDDDGDNATALAEADGLETDDDADVA